MGDWLVEVSDWLVEVSVWLALVLYPFGLLGARSRLSVRAARRSRRLFALGGVLFLVHVATAFVVHYDLSHAVAVEETARQTEELTGYRSGFGLYLNYLFAGMWWTEILWWYAAPTSYRSRATVVSVGVHVFLLFMIVNGAIVFVPWPRQAFGYGVIVLCALALWLPLRPSESNSRTQRK